MGTPVHHRALDNLRRAPDWRQAPDNYLYDIPYQRAAHLLTTFQAATPDLVVCHGDPCSPNTIIGDDGNFVGLVDVGDLAVNDRWADLAVATWSINWNFGPGWEPLFLQTYGIPPDPDLNDTFRIIWNTSG
jgi:kanamycin kinase